MEVPQQSFLTQPFQIGNLLLANRLIQGPLAGYSCSAMRELVYQFMPPGYCVSEMLSAQNLLQRAGHRNRYTHRAAKEKTLCYQISGTSLQAMVTAASHLEAVGADLIDINCGCPRKRTPGHFTKPIIGALLLSANFERRSIKALAFTRTVGRA